MQAKLPSSLPVRSTSAPRCVRTQPRHSTQQPRRGPEPRRAFDASEACTILGPFLVLYVKLDADRKRDRQEDNAWLDAQFDRLHAGRKEDRTQLEAQRKEDRTQLEAQRKEDRTRLEAQHRDDRTRLYARLDHQTAQMIELRIGLAEVKAMLDVLIIRARPARHLHRRRVQRKLRSTGASTSARAGPAVDNKV